MLADDADARGETTCGLPTMWILGFGLGTLGLWLGAFVGRDGEPPLPIVPVAFLVVWIVGTVTLLRVCVGLKRVRIDGDRLMVSNFSREIAVPPADIVAVTENRKINFCPVMVRFGRPTVFGTAVTFAPKGLRWPFQSHPVVGELKTLAGGALRDRHAEQFGVLRCGSERNSSSKIDLRRGA